VAEDDSRRGTAESSIPVESGHLVEAREAERRYGIHPVLHAAIPLAAEESADVVTAAPKVGSSETNEGYGMRYSRWGRRSYRHPGTPGEVGAVAVEGVLALRLGINPVEKREIVERAI
jgi:hypothetical protein